MYVQLTSYLFIIFCLSTALLSMFIIYLSVDKIICILFLCITSSVTRIVFNDTIHFINIYVFTAINSLVILIFKVRSRTLK